MNRGKVVTEAEEKKKDREIVDDIFIWCSVFVIRVQK